MIDVLAVGPLPVGSVEKRSAGWVGIICLVAAEAALFAYLLFSYFYSAVQEAPNWLPELPRLGLALPNTAVLLASSVAVAWGETGTRIGGRGRPIAGLAIGFILGLVFLGIQLLEWRAKPFTPASGSYASLYFVITGFHMLHVVAGLLMLLAVLVWTALGYFGRVRHAPVTIAAFYWHFVDAVWLLVFFTFYITPRL